MTPPPAEAAKSSSEPAWTVRPASERARREWQDAVQAEPVLMADERRRLRHRPLDRSTNPRRTARLHAGLATRMIVGTTLPQWQHELTGGGRICYCPDHAQRIIWITKVSLTHPKETD